MASSASATNIIRCRGPCSTYNTQLGGYEVNISDQQLKGAPNYANDNDWDWEDRKRAQQVYDYYRVPPYWM